MRASSAERKPSLAKPPHLVRKEFFSGYFSSTWCGKKNYTLHLKKYWIIDMFVMGKLDFIAQVV